VETQRHSLPGSCFLDARDQLYTASHSERRTHGSSLKNLPIALCFVYKIHNKISASRGLDIKSRVGFRALAER